CFGSVVILFVVRGGNLGDLFPYLRLNLLLASGYSSQMTLDFSPFHEMLVISAMIAALIMLPLTYFSFQRVYFPIYLVLFPSLFLVYKHVIVRFDAPHYQS